jgi:hypothetical protein
MGKPACLGKNDTQGLMCHGKAGKARVEGNKTPIRRDTLKKGPVELTNTSKPYDAHTV